MNTGLQDAYNIAWKLAFVIRGHANEKLLDTYEQERLPFAKRLIASTDRAFTIVTSAKWYNRIFRLYLFPILTPFFFRFGRMRRIAFRTVSQIGIKYINSDLTVNRVSQSLSVKSGERFPYIKTNDGQSLYGLMKDLNFYALIFSITKNRLREEMFALLDEFKFLQAVDLSKEQEIISTLKIKKNTIIIVRPDHYIGLITDEGIKVVKGYLKKIIY